MAGKCLKQILRLMIRIPVFRWQSQTFRSNELDFQVG